MKTSTFILFFCFISMNTFSQTGYFELGDFTFETNNGNIQRSNDSLLIIINENSIMKTDYEGNIIWHNELSMFNFLKLFVVPSDGYYIFYDYNIEHISEDGESLYNQSYSLADFGYSIDDFSADFWLSDLYYNGSGFTGIINAIDPVSDTTTAHYWIKCELSTEGSILWQSEPYFFGTSVYVSEPFGDTYMRAPSIVEAGSYDYIYCQYYSFDSVNMITYKTLAGSGDVVATNYSPEEIFDTHYPVSDGDIISHYTTIADQRIFTKIYKETGDTAWVYSHLSDPVAFTYLSELGSGHFVGLIQEYGEFFSSYYDGYNGGVIYEALQYFTFGDNSLVVPTPFFEILDWFGELNFIHGMTTLDGGRLAFSGHNYNAERDFLLITDSLGNYLKADITTDESQINSQFYIYPNPANEYLTIDMKQSISEEAEIIVTDITGRICLQDYMKSNVNSKTLQISHLEAGNYFTTVKSMNKHYGTVYVIVTK